MQCRTANGETPLATTGGSLPMGNRLFARLAIAAATAAAIVSLSVAPALAGEVTGNGMKSHFSQGRSECKFSGLNDKPDSTDPMDPGGRVQSYGYSVVRNGLKAFAPSPGDACNPHKVNQQTGA
jgi:hypothetical protein